MADFWSQYKNDFPDLGGGFKPEIFAQDKVMYPNGHPNTGIDPNPITIPGGPQAQPTYGVKLGAPNDPRLTTQPQPWQRGPQVDPQFGESTTDRLPQPYQQGPTDPWAVPGMWDGRSPYKPSPMPPGWNPGPHDMTVLPSGQQLPDFGMGKATEPPFMPQRIDDPYSMQHIMGTIGAGAGGIGNLMRGQPMNPAQQDMARQALPSGGAFGGGIAIGPNGGFINPGDGSPYQGGMSAMGPQQPMNPSQQSGQVQMQAPDGTMQYVNQEHVPHYQGLGATVMNGSSYGGG